MSSGIITGIALFLATFNVLADTAGRSVTERTLPSVSPPPACVCTKTNEGSFVISNCQCGAAQCVAVVGADGKGASSIACLK
jgi:hypothetical protein